MFHTVFMRIAVVKYVVQTETGDSDDDPVSGVYIILFGEHGNSGIRFLSKSKEADVLFDILKVRIAAVIS